MKNTRKSYLVVEREEFCQKLQVRIVSGQALLERQITSEEALEKFKAEISEWSDYNLELLKQSFNNPENEYRQKYKKSYVHFGFLGSHSLKDNIETQKGKITSYLTAIENLMNKVGLIPTLQNDHKERTT
jgi:hypothetical protein